MRDETTTFSSLSVTVPSARRKGLPTPAHHLPWAFPSSSNTTHLPLWLLVPQLPNTPLTTETSLPTAQKLHFADIQISLQAYSIFLQQCRLLCRVCSSTKPFGTAQTGQTHFESYSPHSLLSLRWGRTLKQRNLDMGRKKVPGVRPLSPKPGPDCLRTRPNTHS